MNKLWRVFTGISVVIASAILYWHGCIRDLQTFENLYVDYFLWGIMVLSICCCLLTFVKRANTNKKTANFLKIIVIVILFCEVFSVGFFVGNSNCRLESEDYIKTEWLNGITLDELELEASNGEENVIYVGRSDCNECKRFEKKLIYVLEEYEVVISAYYTDLDRNGSESKKMYQMLNTYGINEVPAVIIVKDKKLLHLYTKSDIEKIHKYYEMIFEQ